jgi:uncharacterized membrane protein YdfJ with MMPL/SSD domain
LNRGRILRVPFEHAGATLVVALVLGVVAAAVAGSLFDTARPFGFSDPDSESARTDRLHERFAGSAPAPGIVILIDEAAGEASTAQVAGLVNDIPGVARVRDSTELAAADAELPGAEVLVGFLEPSVDDPADVGEEVLEQVGDLPGVTAGGPAVAGYEINEQTAEDLFEVERIAIPIVFLLSLLVFRSAYAALVPVLVGVLSIAFTLAVLRVISEFAEIDVFAINVVAGLGFGLAIDYSLFVVSRYREELSGGASERTALQTALATAGRTVALSAGIVTLALAALLVFPQRFLYSSGLGGALVAVISAIVVLTVLPATLTLLGERVNRGWPARGVATPRQVGGAWYRLAHAVMRRPLPVVTLAAAALLALSVQVFTLNLTAADPRDLPEDRPSREVADRLAELPAAGTAQMVALTRGDESPDGDLLAAVREVSALAGVAGVNGPTPLGDEVARLEIVPAAQPLTDAAENLLERVRELDWPELAGVTGRTAEVVDARESIRDHLPFAIAIVIATSLIAVFALTRSLVLPAVMALMNVLSVAAAVGIVVLVFQEGWLSGIFGHPVEEGIDISIPVLLAAITFGLSTDYGIFVLARIKEARDGGLDEREAVAVGLDRSGRIISAAALLFAVAAGGFVTSELVLLREFSLGLVAAVVIDATIVRALLVPAILSALGPRAWWPGKEPIPAGPAHPTGQDRPAGQS